jgi:hypothetical protein
VLWRPSSGTVQWNMAHRRVNAFLSHEV